MFSKIFLSKSNLLHNIKNLQTRAGKPICVMIKANAYGHGEKEIVSILDGYVDYFGVACQSEALKARAKTDGHIIVFGKCDNYLRCMKNNISFALFSLEDAKNIIKIAKKYHLNPRMHLCLNSGMNRYGFKEKEDIEKTIDYFDKNNLTLEGFYTHFSSLTTDQDYTNKQKQKFYEMKSIIPKEWKTVTHVGGGKSIDMNIEAQMYRSGIECYGYGREDVFPILKIESEIIDIQNVYCGEHVGYLCGFTANKDMKVATIPLGYADGLPRKISGKFEVEINGRMARSVGNVCMDAFMVDVSMIDCKKGDKVKIMDDASYFAPLIESTEYEVLTNFSKLRGKRIITE